ncbi:MAG TPA: tripartite tricarboxylate transporter substrate-binding protein, partial [Burkholderiales bacterium]|nr:tripartite tricarboxylate transporter substrate-binding protein [Burkholderiales bacterium]
AIAQDYPNRPIRLMMPNAPGSSIDTIGRIFAVRLGEALGQQIVIENRAGAAGAIGIELAKNAAPDGYTLLFASASGMSIAPLLQKKIPYDPVNDFAFVSLVAVMPNILVVTPSLPVATVKELIDYARANRGRVNMASAGPGAASHLGGVLLMVMGDFDSLHVPYKDGGPSVASVVAGESHWTVVPAPAAMSLVKAGRLRAVAHTLPERAPLFGDLPTIAETVPGYDYSGWAGLLAPKGTPASILDKVHAALVKTVGLPAVKDGFAAQGAEAVSSSPEAFREFLQRDIANTAKVIKAAGLQAE